MDYKKLIREIDKILPGSKGSDIKPIEEPKIEDLYKIVVDSIMLQNASLTSMIWLLLSKKLITEEEAKAVTSNDLLNAIVAEEINKIKNTLDKL